MQVCWIASVVSDCATLWTVVHQTPLSIGFSRQEYWNGLPFPSLSHDSVQFSSVTQSCPILCNPHESQHFRPPCPSPTPRVHSDSHTAIRQERKKMYPSFNGRGKLSDDLSPKDSTHKLRADKQTQQDSRIQKPTKQKK